MVFEAQIDESHQKLILVNSLESDRGQPRAPSAVVL